MTDASRDAESFVMDMLRGLASVDTRFTVDELEHSLQTATRAERAGAADDMVFAALCHDVGKVLHTRSHTPHGALAAELIRPFVRAEVAWVVAVHEDFTARHLDRGLRRHRRYRHRLHPHYELAARFVDEWDCPSRDPRYDTLPLAHFEPLVHRVLAGASPSRRRVRFERAIGRIPEPYRSRVERAVLALRDATRRR